MLKNYFILLFLLASGIFCQCHAQKLLAVTYKSSRVIYIDSSHTYSHQNETVEDFMHNLATVSNDTASLLFYSIGREKMPKRSFKKVMGKKLVHHTIFNDFIKKISWEEVDYPNHANLLVARPFDSISWKLFDVSKTILGHTCKMAMSISAKNDSTILWYTNDFPNYAAKLNYNNAPGVILAAETQLNNNLIKYTAVDIFEYEGELFFPENGKRISEKDFQIWRRKHLPL